MRVLSFEKENEQWLDFVCACRKGEELNKDYDIIIGNVANDDVFKTVDMYFRGLWDKKRVLEELRYYKMNDQICLGFNLFGDKISAGWQRGTEEFVLCLDLSSHT